MKKYIDADLQVVRLSNRDIVTESFKLNGETGIQLSGDRFGYREDWDAGY